MFSFDFRGLGETRMRYRAESSDDPELAQASAEQAYSNPLVSVLGGYVYNSLLTGRPYFLQLMDDLKIAERFIRSQDRMAQAPLTVSASGDDAYSLAAFYREIEPEVKMIAADQRPLLDWSELVAKSEEDWPIAFLLPSGAFASRQIVGREP